MPMNEEYKTEEEKEYYNNEIKHRYISWKKSNTTTPEGSLGRAFDICKPFEEKFGKDVYDFNQFEIIEMYKNYVWTSIDSLYNLNSRLALYGDWALSKMMVKTNINYFRVIDRQQLQQCIFQIIVEKSVITREQVLDLAKQLENPSDAFILLCLFEGICGKEYLEIALAEVKNITCNDLENITIHVTDSKKERDVMISKELYHFALEADTTYVYSPLTGETIESINLVPTQYIINDFPGVWGTDPDKDLLNKGRRIYTRLVRILKWLGTVGINKMSLINSGIIHYINTESEKLGISGEEFLTTDDGTRIAYIKKQFGRNIVKSTFISKYGFALRK